MNRSALATLIFVTACVPPAQTVHVAPVRPQAANIAPARQRVAVRGRAPRGQRIDFIVAVQVDQRTGRRTRVRVRPAVDGSYALHLPRGQRYKLAYESGGRMVGEVKFPTQRGQPNNVLSISTNVVVNNYVDLGEPSWVGGVFVATHDPYSYLDSDGDGTYDIADQDDDNDGITDVADHDWDNDGGGDDEALLTSDASFSGEFEEVEADVAEEYAAPDDGDNDGIPDADEHE